MGERFHTTGSTTLREESILTSSFSVAATIEEVPHRQREPEILTLTPFYPSAQCPSQGRFVSDPIEHMKDVGVSNQTIAVQPFYRGHARSAEHIPANWMRHFSVPGNCGLPSAGEFLAARLMRTLRQRSFGPFNLIHAHAALPCGHAAEILSNRLSIPFVVTVHGRDAFFIRQTGPVVSRWCCRVAKNVYRRARRVICISEKVRREVLNEVQANTVVVYNGVDPEFFSPAPESHSRQIVLSVGNLTPTKRHALLLRAFARIAPSLPNCFLEIIGDGPERATLIRLAEDLRIADRVQFTGRQSRDYVANAMRRCSVFALPSSYEGLGCVYLEAMACAKPVIGCWGQGIDEVIEHAKTGLLVAPENEDELTESLQMLLQNEELRRRMGAAARNLVLQKFTLDHQAQSLAQIYRECIA